MEDDNSQDEELTISDKEDNDNQMNIEIENRARKSCPDNKNNQKHVVLKIEQLNS